MRREHRRSVVCWLTRRHWWVERVVSPLGREERCVVCRFCGPGHMGERHTYRCSNIGDPAPCTFERHHQMRGAHRHSDGVWVGGYPRAVAP